MNNLGKIFLSNNFVLAIHITKICETSIKIFEFSVIILEPT